jgi:hypothetical protein
MWLLLAGCLPQHSYQSSAPPVVSVVALVEQDTRVAEALGEDATVSLAISREFERDWVRSKLEGRDQVRLITEVQGSRGEATLTLDATNIDEQGWAGRFALELPARQVLKDGAYVSEGGSTLLSGTFAPDGSPVVK